ncbi:MAG TPA: methyltransferase domain-containing protein [Elusimicrobiota bacterium]|nr:methyltransferase domain-containing protein [Elusimicrobiota bacterium]
MPSHPDYVHGYHDKESARLDDQSACLEGLLHWDTAFPKGSRILEAGCGIGSQTRIIARKNPDCSFLSVDLSTGSLQKAKDTIRSLNIPNVQFQIGDILNLQFADETFDHVFVCFTLEHLPSPLNALQSLRRVLKKGGTLMVIEGDHGSAYFHPDSPRAAAVIGSLVKLQSSAGGNALIGRELHPLLTQAGFQNCRVSPRMVYADSSNPGLVDCFTRKTFIAMIAGVRERVIAEGLMEGMEFDQGIDELERTARPGGVFCYTFFKAVAVKPET